MELRLKNVRIAFPALAEPEAFGDGDPAYQAKFILEPGSDQDKAVKAAVGIAAKEKWKDEAGSVLNLLVEAKKVCFVEGPYKSQKTGLPYAGFEGMHYLSSRNSKDRPTILDRFGAEVTDTREIKRLVYSGCIVHAKVEIYAQDSTKWGRRVNCNLLGVMYASEGSSFGGTPVASASDFADLAESAEDFV